MCKALAWATYVDLNIINIVSSFSDVQVSAKIISKGGQHLQRNEEALESSISFQASRFVRELEESLSISVPSSVYHSFHDLLHIYPPITDTHMPQWQGGG
ncbi:hypothetical protein Leryth_006694 [Lithospermum erythrorhizon]|nr:hypothetical protein Leryth_006694 [Lithospermum erythrorhizon]